MVDLDLLETMEILKLDSKISTLNQTSMDTDSPKLEIKFQITEMETDSELELQLIPLITPLEEELLLLTEDSTHKETETLSSLDSKTLLPLKTTHSEQKLLALETKSQTTEVETLSKLEPQLTLWAMLMDQKQSHLDKDSTHKEMETNSSLVSKTLECSDKTQPPGHQLDQLKP